jgi:hypothetical protein
VTGKHGSYSGSPTDLGSQGITTTFTTHRTLDPVRGAALAAAVELARELRPIIGSGDDQYGQLAQAAGSALAIAKEFEAYLTGEEAHGDNP